MHIGREEVQSMTVSKAQKKAVQKYVAEKYDRIVLTIKKNSKYGKEQIQDAAAAAGVICWAYSIYFSQDVSSPARAQ